MNQTQYPAGHSESWIKTALAWALVLAVSTGVAYAMNTAAVRALSTSRPSTGVSAVFPEVSNLCALDVDGALYAGLDWWLPAGRTAFCRADTYPGVAGRNDIATQLSHVGPLQATITFAASNVRIDLYCPTSTQQRSAERADADFVSAAEVRHLYEDVCMVAGSSE